MAALGLRWRGLWGWIVFDEFFRIHLQCRQRRDFRFDGRIVNPLGMELLFKVGVKAPLSNAFEVARPWPKRDAVEKL